MTQRWPFNSNQALPLTQKIAQTEKKKWKKKNYSLFFKKAKTSLFLRREIS